VNNDFPQIRVSLLARRVHSALRGVGGRAVEDPHTQLATEAAAADGVSLRGVKKQKQAGD